MEKFLTVDSDDGHLIYGTLNSYEEKKGKLIIFVHGLSGNQHEHQYFNAVPYFCSRGYDVFRFDFYGGEDKCRPSSESSVSTHARDLNSVLNNFKDDYEELYLVGHSFGCLAIMNADTKDVKKIVYWDPTCWTGSPEDKGLEYNESMDKYILRWGWDAIVSKELVREWMKTDDVKKYSERLKGDCSFIFSGRRRYEIAKDYLEGCDFSIIGEGGHRFVEEGVLDMLFGETLGMLEN